MQRSDYFLIVIACAAVCLIGGGQCEATGHQRERQTTLPRIGREPSFSPSLGSSSGRPARLQQLLDEAAFPPDASVKRAMRLMRIGRGRRNWDANSASEAEESEAAAKRAMRLMRLGRHWDQEKAAATTAAVEEEEKQGGETAAKKRAMRLMRLGKKKSAGGFYRPSFRYGK